MKVTKKLDKKNKTLSVKVNLEKSAVKQRINAQKVFNYVMEDDKLAEEVVLTSLLRNDTIVSNPDEDVEGEWVFSVTLNQKPEPKKTRTTSRKQAKDDEEK